MRTIAVSMLFFCVAITPAVAQQWEFGGMGGGSFLTGVGVSAPFGSAKAGFQTGAVAGVFLSQNMYRHWSGELRYGFMQSNLKLSSGGSDATFAGNAHVLHYDMVFHTSRGEARTQYFVAFGGGMKIFSGTGAEQAYQPLSQFGYFTKTTTVKAMASVGAGLRYTLRPKLFLRLEVRDYISAFPTEVITPAPNTKYGSILQDIVPMVGISYLF